MHKASKSATSKGRVYMNMWNSNVSAPLRVDSSLYFNLKQLSRSVEPYARQKNNVQHYAFKWFLK